MLGQLSDRTNNYPKALDYFLKALKADEEIKDSASMGKRLNSIGNIYLVRSEYARTIEYYTRSAEISEKHNKVLYGDAIRNIGIIKLNQGNYPEA